MKNSDFKILESIQTLLNPNFSVLNSFVMSKQDQGPALKRVLKYKLIMSLKKAVRLLKENNLPNPNHIFYFGVEDFYGLEIWLILKSIIQDSPENFEKIHQSKKKSENETSPVVRLTYTDFNKEFFSPECIRKFYFFFMELLFFEYDAEKLSVRFQCRCCSKEMHDVDCLETWFIFKDYLQNQLISELDLQPFINQLWCGRLPTFNEISKMVFSCDYKLI